MARHSRALSRLVAMSPALLLSSTLLLSACGVGPQSGAPTVTERWDDTRPVARNDAALRDAMLTGHNSARRAVGVAPLSWDPALVVDAAAYAHELARTGRFEHAPHDPRNPEGENLFRGTRSAYRYEDMVSFWVDERRYYQPGPVPTNSTTGRPGDVGHYTQIIWRSTRRVGCALASNASDDYLVCRYSPAGNVIGSKPL